MLGYTLMSLLVSFVLLSLFFFFKAPPTTAIYTLSLHDALPISGRRRGGPATLITTLGVFDLTGGRVQAVTLHPGVDRKSTRLNSSHQIISYAVFCLKKKKPRQPPRPARRPRWIPGRLPALRGVA